MKRSVAALTGNNKGGAPNDLLVCFPSRGHLSLLPKPFCSPSRPTDPTKRHLSRSTNRGHASHLFRSKTTNHSSAAADITDEPTSPTVTCAGQIRVRPKSISGPKPTASRNSRGWLSVVEEIERIHRQRKNPLMQFLGALRSLRLDLNCFGSFHGSVDCSEDGEEEEEADEGEETKTIFSKWFMVLEEKQRIEAEQEEMEKEEECEEREEVVAPPPNALLLMRCRSAPAKGGGRAVVGTREEELTVEDEKEKGRMLLTSHATDFFKVSTEIAKETWVVGNFDPLARCRSWKR